MWGFRETKCTARTFTSDVYIADLASAIIFSRKFWKGKITFCKMEFPLDNIQCKWIPKWDSRLKCKNNRIAAQLSGVWLDTQFNWLVSVNQLKCRKIKSNRSNATNEDYSFLMEWMWRGELKGHGRTQMAETERKCGCEGRGRNGGRIEGMVRRERQRHRRRG